MSTVERTPAEYVALGALVVATGTFRWPGARFGGPAPRRSPVCCSVRGVCSPARWWYGTRPSEPSPRSLLEFAATALLVRAAASEW